MNKSEVELANCEAIIAQMPAGEQEMCRRMIDSLLASVGHPIHGRVFMIAVAHVNCNVAVTSIRLGLVDAKGEPTARYPETKREENAALRHIGTEAGQQDIARVSRCKHGTFRYGQCEECKESEAQEKLRHESDIANVPRGTEAVDYRLCDGDVDD